MPVGAISLLSPSSSPFSFFSSSLPPPAVYAPSVVRATDRALNREKRVRKPASACLLWAMRSPTASVQAYSLITCRYRRRPNASEYCL